MFYLWMLCGFLSIIIIVLCIILFVRNKDVKELQAELSEHLLQDTNHLLTLSSHHKPMRQLAAVLNKQLFLLRAQRHQYLYGSQALKEDITNISHDLRTPLTAINGYLELLEGEETSISVTHYLSIIRERIELMNQLTEELFQYSMAVMEEKHIVEEKICLNQKLEESIAGYYTLCNEHHIEPCIHMPRIHVIRTLDPVALSRVLSNLLHNAIKYSDGDLDITLSEKGEITFLNSAAGLDQLQVERLFDRYYTVASAQKSTGLGLGITRNLIKQMEGTITAAYVQGKLCICIYFPEDQAD